MTEDEMNWFLLSDVLCHQTPRPPLPPSEYHWPPRTVLTEEEREEINKKTCKEKKLTIDYRFECLGLINKSHFAVITVLTSEWIVITPPSRLRYNQRFSRWSIRRKATLWWLWRAVETALSNQTSAALRWCRSTQKISTYAMKCLFKLESFFRSALMLLLRMSLAAIPNSCEAYSKNK